MIFFIEIFLSKRKEIEADSIAWILAKKSCLIQNSYLLSKQPGQYDTKGIILKLSEDITKPQSFYHVVSQNAEELQNVLLKKSQEYDKNAYFILKSFFDKYNIVCPQGIPHQKPYKSALEKVLHTIELFEYSNLKTDNKNELSRTR